MTDPTSRQITRRRVRIDFGPARSSGWHVHKDIENFLNAVSYVFPAGERFFIDSVRHYENRITDPVLKEQVQQFIYQEAMHAREHARGNRALDQAFPHGHEIEKIAEWSTRMYRRFYPRASQLAATCALEHLTALLANFLLTHQQRFISENDRAFATLWLWHAVEETEHKAVCFDLYQHVVGKGVLSYLHRVAIMFWVTMLFLALLVVVVNLTGKGDKDKKGHRSTATSTRAPSTRRLARMAHLGRLIKSAFPLRLYFDCYRPSFHPWNHDNAHLIAKWKQLFAGFGTDPDATSNDVGAYGTPHPDSRLPEG